MSNALASSPRSESVHEFGFSDRDFEQVRRMIYDHAGIALSPAKREMVYSRLSRRLRERYALLWLLAGVVLLTTTVPAASRASWAWASTRSAPRVTTFSPARSPAKTST